MSVTQVSALTSRRRRLAVALAALAGLTLAVAIVAMSALVAAAMFGVSIDASLWRDAAAQRASAALGRPVTLQGHLELKLGRELQLRAGGVRVMNPAGFSGPEFLAIGAASARIDVFDALRGRWRLRSIEASDVVLRLERSVDGRGNWSMSPRHAPTVAPAAIDIDRFTLRGLALHYQDAGSGTRRVLSLDELSGSAGRNDRLRLAASGRATDQRPYTLKLDGGPLRLLQEDAEPWPFTLDIDARGAALHANGSLDMRSGRAGFGFTARADGLESLGRLVGAQLPPSGPATLQGTVAAAADAIELSSFRGRLGASEVSGQLALAFGGTRPRLSGSLDAAALDMRELTANDQGALGKTLDDGAPAPLTLSLRKLLPVDLAVDMKVSRWLGLPVEIHDASFELRGDAQGLRAPMRLRVAGVPFAGGLQLDSTLPTPALALELAAKEVALDDLAHDLARSAGVEGTLGRLGLRVDGQGETLGSLVRDLALSLSVAAAKLRVVHGAVDRPIAFTLDTLQLALRRGERLRGQARGSLLGERASLSIRGGTVADMLHERAMPIEIELALPQARLRVEATLPPAEPSRDGGREAALGFDFRAGRSGDLAHWLGVAPESNLAVALRGRVRSAEGSWHLERTTLELGRSVMAIDARRTLSEGRPLIQASLRSPLIDGQELATLRTDPGAGVRIGTGTGVDAQAIPGARPNARLDTLIFPATAALADADIDLQVQRLRLGQAELADFSLNARTREGRLLPSPVTGRLADAPFTARVELELRGALPMASVDLSTGAIDVGLLLRQLGVAEDIDGQADAMHLKLLARGSSLRELAEHSAVEARFVGGRISVLGAAQRAVAEIGVSEASIAAVAGAPVRVRLDGTLDQNPVKIDVRSGSLAELARDASRLPFAMVAQAAGTRLALEGEVALPLGRDAQLMLEMSGERLDTLSALARVELPPWGPWSLRGPLRMTPTGYEVRGLRVAVGQSRLGGSGHLDISGPRPHLRVQVAAPSIQLDDFPLPERLADASAPPGRGDGLRVVAGRLAGRADTLLSAAFLRRLDADIDVKAKEVLSGADRLADGALHLQLKEGRLHLDPALVNLPGGSMRLSMSYDLKEAEVDFAMTAHVERFDYGIIARRMRRADDLKGLFSLNLQLKGKAPSLAAIVKNADGRLDVAVWPTDLRSGIFNLWSVNLILTLLPLIDPGGHAAVNCIVGRFDLDDGKLSDDKIVIDTTALRIRGAGHADLASEELAFVFRPRAKGFGLFRLQTPLRVTGTLTDQRFGFTQSDVAESVLRLIASPILLPIEWLTQGPLPRDGADLCTDPLRAVGG